jgi:hypothetical protein
MARAKLLEESEREIAAAVQGETEIVAEGTQIGGRGEVPAVSEDEGPVSSGGDSRDFGDEGVSVKGFR